MELGYPTSTQALRNWYNEYKVNGKLHHKDDTQRKYSKEERLAVIQYYLENGQNIKKTIRDLGYPSRQALRQWLKEEVPEDYHPCQRNHANVYFSQSQKEQAVIAFCAKIGSGKEIAAKYGTSRESLYVWKKKLLPKEIPKQMAKKKEPTTREEAEAMIAELKAEVAQLTEQTEDLKKNPEPFDRPGVFFYRSFATSSLTFFMSSVGSNLATTFPSLSTRNFVKFHLMSGFSL